MNMFRYLSNYHEQKRFEREKYNVIEIIYLKINLVQTYQGFQSGPVPATFTHLRSCIVPAEITEPPKISGGENHKYDGR